jgi:hypothetical protein
MSPGDSWGSLPSAVFVPEVVVPIAPPVSLPHHYHRRTFFITFAPEFAVEVPVFLPTVIFSPRQSLPF